MKYKAYVVRDKNGVATESRKVRKGARKEKFAYNQSLHSGRAKQERRDARRAAQQG